MSTSTTPETFGFFLWMLMLSHDRSFKRNSTNGMLSFRPDAHWVAYGSDESGRNEIYAQPFPGPGEKRQISTQGGRYPFWARSGRELFYLNGNAMMEVDITAEPAFQPGTPRLLFETDSFLAGGFRPYDVTADGERFIMVQPLGESSTQLNVVQNWFEELKRLVPTN